MFPWGKTEGNIEVEGKQKYLFPTGQILSVLLNLLTKKQKKKLQKIVCLTATDMEHDLIMCQSKVQVIVL